MVAKSYSPRLLAAISIVACCFNLGMAALDAKPIPAALQKAMAAHAMASSSGKLSSSLRWRDCQTHLVLQPKSTEQVADVIMAMHREHKSSGTRFLVRASRQEFLSTNNFSCAFPAKRPLGSAMPEEGSEEAEAAQSGNTHVYSVALDMSDMSDMIRLDEDDLMITVQAGMTFEALEELLFEHHLSLPNVYVTPILATMTLGAALVTGAHGSALEGYATLAPYVRRAVMVDGTGEVRVLTWPGELLEGSLGLLGVVTEMTLQLTAVRKVLVKQLQAEDLEMVSDLREIIDASAALSLDVTWSPAAGMYTARVWHAADEDDAGHSANTFMEAPLAWLDKLDARLHRDQMDRQDRGAIMCELLGDMSSFPFFQETSDMDMSHSRGHGPPGDAHVGWLNHMAAPRCPDGEACIWRRSRLTPHELGISGEDLASWVEDARRIMARARSCPSFVFNLRFVPGTSSPLAMHFGRHTVAIDISTHASLAAPTAHVKQQALFDEVVQMTMCRYEGRPHWASGTNRMYTGPCPLRDMYGPEFEVFLEKRRSFDPSDLFLSPLFQRVADRRGGDLYPGCAAENECFCQEDVHCGPHHECVPGSVFPEFNVCAPDDLQAAVGGEL